MNDDNEVQRYVWKSEGMEEYIRGNYVEYDDYKELLEVYQELKWRMEQLEE